MSGILLEYIYYRSEDLSRGLDPRVRKCRPCFYCIIGLTARCRSRPATSCTNPDPEALRADANVQHANVVEQCVALLFTVTRLWAEDVASAGALALPPPPRRSAPLAIPSAPRRAGSPA